MTAESTRSDSSLYRKLVLVICVFVGSATGCITYHPTQNSRMPPRDYVGSKASYGELGFVISFSGGGIRASNFALGSLLALDAIVLEPFDEDANGSERPRTLLDELDYASTVSGGGLGVAVLVAERYQHQCKDSNRRLPLFYLLQTDSGGRRVELLRRRWSGAFLGKLNPKAWGKARSNTDLFERSYFGELAYVDCPSKSQLTLADVQSTAENSIVHIPNSTLSSSGFVFPFTEAILDEFKVQSSGFDAGEQERTNSRAANMRYTQALVASAAFPPILSDVRLATGDGTEGFLHLTDGGQADDNGIRTALEALARLSKDRFRESPVIYVAVDALPTPGYNVVSNDHTMGFWQTVFQRNYDLPRYGAKRELQNLVYDTKKQRIRTEFDSKRLDLYVAHVPLWAYDLDDAKDVKVGTIQAGLIGFDAETQSAIIASGISMTLRALLHVELNEVHPYAQRVSDCVVGLADCADRRSAWNDLVEHASRASSNVPAIHEKEVLPGYAGLVEFRRQSKLANWQNVFRSNAEDAREQRIGFSSLIPRFSGHHSVVARQFQEDVSQELDEALKMLGDPVKEMEDSLFVNGMSAAAGARSKIEDQLTSLVATINGARRLALGVSSYQSALKPENCQCLEDDSGKVSCSTTGDEKFEVPIKTIGLCEFADLQGVYLDSEVNAPQAEALRNSAAEFSYQIDRGSVSQVQNSYEQLFGRQEAAIKKLAKLTETYCKQLPKIREQLNEPRVVWRRDLLEEARRLTEGFLDESCQNSDSSAEDLSIEPIRALKREAQAEAGGLQTPFSKHLACIQREASDLVSLRFAKVTAISDGLGKVVDQSVEISNGLSDCQSALSSALDFEEPLEQDKKDAQILSIQQCIQLSQNASRLQAGPDPDVIEANVKGRLSVVRVAKGEEADCSFLHAVEGVESKVAHAVSFSDGYLDSLETAAEQIENYYLKLTKDSEIGKPTASSISQASCYLDRSTLSVSAINPREVEIDRLAKCHSASEVASAEQ
ncbi:MAG: hypothetical protein AAGI88_02390 [Pseudomonadota bacterium]